MIIKRYIPHFFFIFLLASCVDLNLEPLSEGSNENWYSDQTEIEMSLNDLYRTYVWNLNTSFQTDRWTDDWAQRLVMYDFAAGSITSEWDKSETTWVNTYKGISRANRLIENTKELEGILANEVVNMLKAEASFFRAVFYSRLVRLYGDVPFFTGTITIDEAFAMGRTDKNVVLDQVYADFDFAIEHLPERNNNSGVERANKGAALAMKAQAALWQSDWQTVVETTQEVMASGNYSLYPDYGAYFQSKRIESETIFSIPQSNELGFYWAAKNFLPRTAGGNAVAQPSWELLAVYPCTDGLMIDESPLFDPKDPFKNRDPRATYTFVAFGSEFLGYIYQPHPDSTKTLNVKTGQMVNNMDTKGYTQHASYNGMALRKFVTQSFADLEQGDEPIIIMRYADVLLMYAEAKIELNQIDQSVLDAMNQVRARAYQADYKDTDQYPAFATTNQSELRKQLRVERRIEFAWENRRYWDLLRWEMFEEALARPYYGLLPITEMREKLVATDSWFWPFTPEIDENDLPNLDVLYNQGYIAKMADRNFTSKQYLWPIPNKDVLINPNIKQNPGY